MKHLHLLLSGITALCASTALAAPVYYPTGSNLTYGHSSNTQSIYSFTNNPAMGATALRDGSNDYKFGIITLGAGVEVGDVNNIEDTINESADDFDNIQLQVGPTPTPQEVNNAIISAVETLNKNLRAIEQDGYLKVLANAQPISPIVVAANWLGGALVLNIDVTSTTKGIILQEDVFYNGNDPLDPNDHIDYDPNTQSLRVINNDTTFLASTAATAEIGLGYSRLAWSGPMGDIYGGLRAKMVRVGLLRVANRLDDLDSADTALEDISDKDVSDNTEISFDIGAMWNAKHFRLGATLTNINEPSFDYNGIDLSAYTDPNGDVYQRLLTTHTYVLERQLKLEGALHSESSNWVLNMAMDATAAQDPFGDEYQWAVASAAYANDGYLIPSFRVGLRKNLSGSKLSYLTAGLTAFKVMSLDLAYGLEKVEVDGSKYPRSFYANLGFSVSF